MQSTSKSFCFLSLVVCLSSALALLTGCGGTFQVPDAATPGQTLLGTIQGSHYGGHAPIVGSHVFVLEGTTSTTGNGYNQPSKSLLSATYSGTTYPTALEPAGTAVSGDYYVTTGAGGSFSISGDYTCDAGYPVYLYAEGGNPTTVPTVTLTNFSITSNVVSFTNSGGNLLYQGEAITVAGAPTAYSYLNGAYMVSSTGLTTTTFQVALSNANVASTALSSGTAMQSSVANNPAIVNIAVLGVCPSTGSQNFSSLQYVYINEVSTAAAAYALGGFFPAPGTSGVVVAGASSANLSIPASDPLALTGLANAALTAGQLYDIQGSITGTGGDGDTHIARATTAVGGGTVPQALINTIANILANCVDSANTSSSASSQCTTLFADTSSTGVIGGGTKPIDTASAAIDIAHNPLFNVSALIGSPTGNAPYQPSISSANDLSVGIIFTPPQISSPTGIAVDGLGRIWYSNSAGGYVTTLSPVGAVLYNTANGGDGLGYITIDGNGTAWYGDGTLASLKAINSAGTYVGSYDAGNLTTPVGIVADGTSGTGYIYVEQNATPSVDRFDGNGVLAGTNPLPGATSCLGTYFGNHLAADNNTNGFNVWITSDLGDFVCEVNTSGTLLYKTVINATQGTGGYRPEFVAIDASGNAWIANQGNASIDKITQAGVLSNPTGGTLSGAVGVALDGKSRAFVTNRTSNSVTEYVNGGTAVSATNLYGGGNVTVMSDPFSDAFDPSGNLWITNYYGNRIVEMVGIGFPTYTPLSSAAYVNKLGTRP
jgi:streptogramin lyase